VVHPRQARDLARAPGPWAQTEAVEARALAPCAEGIRPPPRPRPAAQTQALRALLGRRPPRIGLRTAAQHRLAGTSGRLLQDLEAQMAWLHTRLATLDAALETRLRASPRWRANDALWQRVPGMGPGCARPLRRARPALGTRTRPQSAALVGVAPLTCARGTLRGRRPLWGGRAPVRPVRSMGTLGATRFHPPIKALYQRLLAAGKRTKVALTACMPKWVTMLKAMLKHRTSWQAQEVQNEKRY
jgi:transposase